VQYEVDLLNRAMPTSDELVFALKTFLGAMLALAFAFWLGLDNPYWCMATAYIVAQPLTGAMRSKALYRFFGTFIGGTASVVLVPNLVNAPVLLSLGLSLWIGLCLFLSLLDRSPRAYLFMLAGYTAGIIGFPSVADPAHIFQTALTRVEEITIGIACTTVVGTVFFPRALGPVLAARIKAWLMPAGDWAESALAGREQDFETWAARRRMAAEAGDIGMMTSQLAYDTSTLQSAVPQVRRLRLYILSLMPVLASIGDRVAQLRLIGGVTPALQTVLGDLTAWIRNTENYDPAAAESLDGEVARLERDCDQELSWAGILRTSLLVRLHEFVAMVRHSRAIRHHVVDDAEAPTSVPGIGAIAAPTQVRDYGLALLSAAAAVLATLLVCGFWIVTGWTAGAGAAVMVAVACSFFAAQDDPAPMIAQMLRNAIIVIIADAIYVFAILPRVETFPELMLVLLPAGLVIGVLVSRPATFGTGMVMGAVGSTILALNNGYAGDFAGYVNAGLGLVFGLASALVVTRLIRSVGAAWSARRLLRAGWRDIAAAAGVQGHQDRAMLTGLMMDRLGLLMPRLAAVSPGADLAAADVLVDLRLGLNVIGLQSELVYLSVDEQRLAARVLQGVAAHYNGNPLAPAAPALLDAIDRTIMPIAKQVNETHSRHHREALMVLVGLRMVLFADAPPPFDAMPAIAEQVALAAEPPRKVAAETPRQVAAQ
jgi:uncharacterized membrane protein YccC